MHQLTLPELGSLAPLQAQPIVWILHDPDRDEHTPFTDFDEMLEHQRWNMTWEAIEVPEEDEDDARECPSAN